MIQINNELSKFKCDFIRKLKRQKSQNGYYQVFKDNILRGNENEYGF